MFKPTKLSSTGWGGKSENAVDGNLNSYHNPDHVCTHTQKEQGAWWRVDLSQQVQVGMVKITNRGDCCWRRLENFEILVGNVDDPSQSSV